MERQHVARVLVTNAWHKGRACEILGTSRPRVRRIFRHYQLSPPPELHPEQEDCSVSAWPRRNRVARAIPGRGVNFCRRID